ncbi:MFS transporter [Caldiplasma sukawensis]
MENGNVPDNFRYNFLLISRATRSIALSFSAIEYPLYLEALKFNNVLIGGLSFFVIAFTVLQVIILGTLGDRIGYKYSMVLGEIFPIISLIILSFVSSGPLLYLSVVGGIAGGPEGARGAFSPGTTAYVANNWPDPESRVMKIGYVTSVGSFFSTFGGLLVVLFGIVNPSKDLSLYREFFMLCLIFVTISMISLLFLRERKMEGKKRGFISKKSASHVSKVIITNVFNGAGIGLSMPLLSLWFSEMYNVSSFKIGLVLTISYIATGLGSFIASRWKYGRTHSGIIGSYSRIFQGALLVLMALMPFFVFAGAIYVVRMGIAGVGLPMRNQINVSGIESRDYGAGSGLQATAMRVSQSTTGATGYLMDLYLPLPEIAGGLIQAFAGFVYYKYFGKRK